MEGSEELLAHLVDTFMQSYPDQLQSLRLAVQARDGSAIENAAHRLKGSMVVFEAGPASTLCEQLEDLGRQGRVHQADGAFDALEREIARLAEYLRANVRGGS